MVSVNAIGLVGTESWAPYIRNCVRTAVRGSAQPGIAAWQSLCIWRPERACKHTVTQHSLD